MGKQDSGEESQSQNFKTNKVSTLKLIATTTKIMVKNPSMIVKSPVIMMKNFDPIIFKTHAKKHPAKTAALLAVGGLAVGAAATVAVLAAPAAIAVGAVGAVALGAAAVTAGSIAFTVTAAKITIDGNDTISNLNPDEKRIYDAKVGNSWDKKLAAEARKTEEAKKATESRAEKIDQIKTKVKDVVEKFHIKSDNQKGGGSQKAHDTMHLTPSSSPPNKSENSTKKRSSNSIGG